MSARCRSLWSRRSGVSCGTVDPKLHRALLRNRAREASRVLDVLFDAQEYLLPRFAEVV